MQARFDALIRLSCENNWLEQLRLTWLASAGIDVVNVHHLDGQHQFTMASSHQALIASYLHDQLVVTSPAFSRWHYTQQAAVHCWERELADKQRDTPLLHYLRNQAITSGISILVHGPQGERDLYFFGSKSATPLMSSFWMNSIPMLMQFMEIVNQQNFSLHPARTHALDLPKLVGPCFFENAANETTQTHFRPQRLQVNTRHNAQTLQFFDAAALSSQEKKITELALIGRRAKEIAEALHLSPRTVENYLARIREKFHCKSQKELMARFYQAIQPTPPALPARKISA